MERSNLGLISNKKIPSWRYQKWDNTIGFSGTDLAGNNVLDIPKRFNNRGFRSSDVICSDFLRLLRSWIEFLCREILTRFYPSDLRLDSFKVVHHKAIGKGIWWLIPISIVLYFRPSKMKLVLVCIHYCFITCTCIFCNVKYPSSPKKL